MRHYLQLALATFPKQRLWARHKWTLIRAPIMAVCMAIGLSLMPGALVAESARVAEDQTTTGKFLTATEVRPILTATKSSWIAVREFDGNDLLYFTHLLAWRCGLYEVNFSINGGELQPFPIPECAPDIVNAMAIPEDAQVYLTYELGSVQSIEVTLLYDDLGTDTASYERSAVLTP